MVAKRQGEMASDLRSLQREKEREKRRMRDRQRRKNMSLEQRERHLARRRRNYQLRRIRAENAKLAAHHQNQTESQNNALTLTSSGTDPSFTDIQTMEKSVSTIEGGESGIHRRPRRLRMHQIRQLARLLNIHRTTVGDDANPSENCGISSNENGSSCEGGNKTLRLAHIKRLARALKSDNKCH